MTIKIGKSGAAGKSGPHADALGAMSSGATETVTDTDSGGAQETSQTGAGHSEVGARLPDTVTVGFSYKYPTGAPYHMLEIRVERTTAHSAGGADEAFDETKNWAEERLNALIIENQ